MKRVRVVAGVLCDGERYLIARRPDGAHLAGLWEFPGGKVEPNETDQEALARELHEELGVEVEVGELLNAHQFDYKDKSIELVGYRVSLKAGQPQAHHHAEVRWVGSRELMNVALAPADFALRDELLRLATNHR